MASAADELMLLERVFLRLGSADSDEQLETVLGKFLPPVLLKLASQEESVRKKKLIKLANPKGVIKLENGKVILTPKELDQKIEFQTAVMELLIHVNKRTKTRPLVQLPVRALLTQYQDPAVTSFVTNFTIIYIKSGFPRLPVNEQVELVPVVLTALENKPQSHLDSLLFLIIPLLGKVKVSSEPDKVASLFGLNNRPQMSKHLLGLLLDMLLLPYGAMSSQPISNESQSESNTVAPPVPPGMSVNSFKRITTTPLKSEELEEIKQGIVKFLGHGVFSSDLILTHLIVGASDTRFSVANLADMELKKILGSVSWSSAPVTMPLFALFLGTQSKNVKPEFVKLPASTRIRLKLVPYMCRLTGEGFIFPACIQVVFDSLYGENTNTKLKTLALNFTGNIIRHSNEELLKNMAPLLLTGIHKLLNEGEEVHQGQAYVLIGMLAHRFPKIVFYNVNLLEDFFKNLESANSSLKLQIREGFLNLILAYRHDIGEEIDRDGRLNILFALTKFRLTSEDPVVRFVAVRTLATVFPPGHVSSKYLLLLSTGDMKDDVSSEALKCLYGTSRKNDIDLAKGTKIVIPPFSEMANYIYNEADIILKGQSKKSTAGSQTLPFEPQTFIEILMYLRFSLINNLDVPLTAEILRHPCEHTPIFTKHLQSVYDEYKLRENSPLLQYTSLTKQLLMAKPSMEVFSYAVEIMGCVPQLQTVISQDIAWIKDQLSSTKEEIREFAAILYALILDGVGVKEFSNSISNLMECTSSKNFELQHGSILALGHCLEAKLMSKTNISTEDLEALVKTSVSVLVEFLKHQNVTLVGASCFSLGLLSGSCALPLEPEKQKDGSPDAKRSANGKVTKFQLVTQLIDVMNNTKLSPKTREKAAKALGLLCVGERFIYTKEVIQGFLNTSKDTKDVEVHFAIGESLVMCCQSIWSPEARNFWTTLPSDYSPNSTEVLTEDNLEWLLDELIKLSKQLHPNTKQASCIWLLAVLNGCSGREPVTSRLKTLQDTFMNLLCESSDIVQEAASKGVCIIYDSYKSEELLNALVKQLTSGTRQAVQVSSDTKLFEEGALGSTPTGGNLTTYKELCSFASDLNKPDLIYQFMHLANHNAIWNSKKGAAFGFSTIAKRCGKDLQPHLALITPKLYRYQFDPNSNIQLSMSNIWKVLVTEPQKMLDQYFEEILNDLLENLNSNQYRVRQSCCLALQDFLKGYGNRSIHDCIDHMDDLWTKLFRVMDDHHEETRHIAIKTGRVLSNLCIRGCDVGQGKAGVRMVEAILPPLLNHGITNPVAEIRLLSLQTISELVGSAGKQLKPVLAKLIPALLQATGESESTRNLYLSTLLGAHSQAQEQVDDARASIAKSHFTTVTVTKALQYADASILEELIPKIVELMKGSVTLGARIASAHFITLLVVQLGKDIQPYTGKLLATLVNGLTDRNPAIRKHYASAIGHLVSTAKESSLEKLFAKLQFWYFEREDDSTRSACAYTIQSIGTHNQDILKTYSDVLIPLIFFAMHSEKTPETEKTLEVWTEIWSEHSPGTEFAIRQHLDSICNILKTALESPSWTMKAQAANAVSTVASKLGSSLDPKQRNALITILISGLAGRTWNGKDKVLKALASVCSNCKDTLKNQDEVDVQLIIEAVIKECKKEEINYKIDALHYTAEIISSLEVDRFDEVYKIIEPILGNKNLDKKEEDISAEEMSTKQGNNIRLIETAYETLGKTWPRNGKSTQEKYRQTIVEHCVKCLPSITRTVQVSVVSALYNFVDKLVVLNEDIVTDSDKSSLTKIVDDILTALRYTLRVTKSTKLRKESLNVVFCLGSKLKERHHVNEFNQVRNVFNDVLQDIATDNQPEIKSRVTDIKNILQSIE